MNNFIKTLKQYLFKILLFPLFLASPVFAAPSVSVVFLLDESGSVSSSNFNLETQGFSNTLSELPLDGSIELSVIGFSSSSSVIVDKVTLTPSTIDGVSTALTSNQQNRGGTNITGALTISESVLSSSSAGTSVICLATDGQPNNANSAIATAANIKSNGVVITPIGIGLGSSGKQFLDTIANDPPVSNPANFTDFAAVVTNRCVGVAVNALNVALTPNVLDFSANDASAGQLACRTEEFLSLTNRAQSRASIQSITITGEDAANYSIVAVDDLSYNIASFPRRLSALSSQSISVALNPTAQPDDGTYNAIISIEVIDDDGNSVTLTSTLIATDQSNCLSLVVRDARPLVKSISTTGYLATDNNGSNRVTAAEIDALVADSSMARSGLVADGNARLLLVGQSAQTSGTMRFFIPGPIQSLVSLGSIDSSPDTGESLSVDISIEEFNGLGQATAVLRAGEHFTGGADVSEIAYDVSMCVLDANGNCDAIVAEESVSLKERRAPVLLIHGLWANANSFLNKIDDNGNVEQLGLYHQLNNNGKRGVSFISYDSDLNPIANFQPNVNKIADKIDTKCRQQVQNHQLACNRADLVGHSMGGLVARHYIDTNAFHTTSNNFQKGSVRRLLTMGTPHKGSGLATILMNMRPAPEINNCVSQQVTPVFNSLLGRSLFGPLTGEQAVDLIVEKLNEAGNTVDRTSSGAINYLALNSNGLVALNGRPQQVNSAGMIGRADLVLDNSIFEKDVVMDYANDILQGATGCTAADIHQGFESDLIVSTDSATGRLTGFTSDVAAIHVGMGQNQLAIDWVLNIIDEPLDGYSSTASLDITTDSLFDFQNKRRATAKISEWLLNSIASIPTKLLSVLPMLLGISDANAQTATSLSVSTTTVAAGEELVFNLSNTDNLFSVDLIGTNVFRESATNLPVVWRYTPNVNDVGTIRFTAVGLDQSGAVAKSNSISVTVSSTFSDLRSIAFEPASPLVLFPGRSEITILSAQGLDGFERSLVGNPSVSYSVNTLLPAGETVISVDALGKVTALRPGTAELIATTSGVTAILDVEVVAVKPEDSDGDGVNDADEISAGANPFSPDFSTPIIEDDPNGGGPDDNPDASDSDDDPNGNDPIVPIDTDLVAYSFPTDGAWYSLQRDGSAEMVCRIDISGCEVAPGYYNLKNWTSGEVTVISIGDSVEPINPVVTPEPASISYSFPADGAWYSLQQGGSTEMICRIDIPDCELPAGQYNLKNWTSGEISQITISASSSPPPTIDNDNALVEFYFPRDGAWYSLQRQSDGHLVCRIDIPPCMIPAGDYTQKNWTSGETSTITIAP